MGEAKTKRPRILALDLLRGAFLVAIIVDHLSGGPSLFHLVTGGGNMFASPAEGFFVISGILVGYIYGPRLIVSFWQTTKRLWRRAFVLYSLSVVFTLLYTAIAVSLPDASGLPPIWSRGGDSFLINVFLGRYAYGWADFLPRYAIFMLAAPFFLWFITKGKSWVVLLVSAIGYVFFHKTALFLPFSSWQILFFPAIIIGYHLPTIEKTVKTMASRHPWRYRALLWNVGATTFTISSIVFVLAPMLGYELPPTLHHSLVAIAPYFDKETVGIGRIMLGTLWFTSLYSIVRTHETVINRWTLTMFEFFGKKSLYTYTIHGVVIFCLAVIFPNLQLSVINSTVYAGSVLVLMYILVKSPRLQLLMKFTTYTHILTAILLGRRARSYEHS